ncbi:MAG: three-Cys-motif partner protein TcmP [Dehalococcoidia bacterium]|nr:three-Cys-motif partner protein TcmP [Dehalococcoidia bacterium]
MARGTNYDDLNERLAFDDDGQRTRPGGAWSRDKLALLAYYLPAFSRLCTDKAGGWYFLDGFAGNGVNSSPGFPLAKGTALLGAVQEPVAQHAVLVEKDERDAAVLALRTSALGPRVEVLCGDTNQIVGQVLTRFENRRLPGICVLDPEGLELDWATVEACASQRQGKYPYELLIYFSTPGAARSAGVRAPGLAEVNASRLTRLFGGDSWRDISALQSKGMLPAGDAGRMYLSLYEEQLVGLGYSTVFKRAAVREDGPLVYHMIFATGNDAGRNIMESAFRRAYGGQMPLQF